MNLLLGFCFVFHRLFSYLTKLSNLNRTVDEVFSFNNTLADASSGYFNQGKWSNLLIFLLLYHVVLEMLLNMFSCSSLLCCISEHDPLSSLSAGVYGC